MRKRKLLSLLLVLCMVISVIPIGTFTSAAADGRKVLDPVVMTKNGGNVNGNCYLDKDVTLTSDLIVPSGKILTLDLNDKVLNLNNHVIYVYGMLVLEDRSENPTTRYFEKTYTDSSVDGCYSKQVASANENTISITGGVITGYDSTGYDHTGYYDSNGVISPFYSDFYGAVRNNGVMEMNGGNIVGNKVAAGYNNSACGTGITNLGTLTMNGGVIAGNLVCGDTHSDGDNAGGGVHNLGTFTMNGGEIIFNTATSPSLISKCKGYGAGVYNNGTFTMNGGKINSNKANYTCGGVLNNDGIFTMNSGEIKGNEAIYYSAVSCISMSTNHKTVLSGGIITENKMKYEGAVYTESRIKIGGDIKITGNTNFDGTNKLNLCIGKGAAIDVDPDYSGSCGIILGTGKTGKTGVFSKETNKSVLSRFSSDESRYIVRFNQDKKLEISGPKVMVETAGTGKGSVNTDKTDYLIGDTAGLTITPEIGSKLTSISAYKAGDENTAVKISDGNTLTMPDFDVTVKAQFETLERKMVTLNYSGNGTLSTDDEATKYYPGQTVKLKATPEIGNKLASISAYKAGDDDTKVEISDDHTFIMPDFDVTVKAQFETLEQKTVTLNSSENGTLSTDSGATKYYPGETVKLKVTPNENSSLEKVTVTKEGGGKVSVDDNLSFVMPDCNVVVNAIFFNANNGENYIKLESVNSFSITSSSLNGTMSIKIGDGEWKALTNNNAYQISANQVCYLRGKANISGSNLGILKITSETGNTVKVSGNIMSLIDYENPSNAKLSKYIFMGLFSASTALEDASELKLPARELAEYCYKNMFLGCSALEKAPELPATELAKGCYLSMFNGCSALREAPELPARELPINCYRDMFSGCSALEKAPELPASELAAYCYYSMFDGCSALREAPKLPATKLAESCYQGMFSNCSSLTEAPELPATELAKSCYFSMFNGCSALREAPELPARELPVYCYYSMFNGCNALREAPKLPATKLAYGCCTTMFSGCFVDDCGYKPVALADTLKEEDYNKSYYTWYFKSGYINGSYVFTNMLGETIEAIANDTEYRIGENPNVKIEDIDEVKIRATYDGRGYVYLNHTEPESGKYFENYQVINDLTGEEIEVKTQFDTKDKDDNPFTIVRDGFYMPKDSTVTVKAVVGEYHNHDGIIYDGKNIVTSTGGTIGAAGSTVNYALTEDVELENSITVPAGATVNLCLKGHTLSCKNRDKPVIENNGTLNICNCDSINGAISGGTKGIVNNGTLTINNVIIKDNTECGVENSSSATSLTVSGGTRITGNNGQNLVTQQGKNITVSNPAAYMDIGVTVKNSGSVVEGQFTNDGVQQEYKNYFFSDNDKYAVEYSSSHLELTEGHKVTLNYAIKMGNVSTGSKTTYLKDDTVNLSITPGSNYAVDEIIVDGEAQDSLEFTMPDNDVTVEVTFTELDYEVFVDNSANDSVSVDDDTNLFNEGDNVSLIVSEGYMVEEITYNEINGNKTSLEKGAYSFVMPACDVRVNAKLKYVGTPQNVTVKDGVVINCENYEGKKINLTLSSDTSAVYNGNEQDIASFANKTETEAWGNTFGTLPAIKYYSVSTSGATSGGTALADGVKPKAVGYYYAEAKVGDKTAVVACNIGKAELEISNATVTDKTYDETKDAEVTVVSFDGLKNSETLTINQDYTVSGEFDKTDAEGDDKATKVFVTVTLKDTEKANNYVIKDANKTKEIAKNISKASQIVAKPEAETNGIAAKSVALKEQSGEVGTKYGYSTENDNSKATWYDSNVITDLTKSTTYYFFVKLLGNNNYNEIISESTEITTKDHEHQWNYTAENNVITGTCADGDGGHGDTKTATLTLNAPTLTVYGEAEKSELATIEGGIDGVVNPEIEYYKVSGTSDTKLDSAPTDAGEYVAKISLTGLDGKTATASKEYTIEKAEQNATTTDSTAESIKGKADGTLTGLASTMEYKKDGASTYISVPENTTSIENLGSGKYYVRYKETDNYNASQAQEVTIAEGKPLTLTFDTMGGSSVDSQTGLTYNDTVSEPANPTREGSMFNGWYLNGKRYDFTEKVTKDITLEAYWIINKSDIETTIEGANDTTIKVQIVGEEGVQASGLESVARDVKNDGNAENNVKLVLTVDKTEETTENAAQISEIKKMTENKSVEFKDIDLTKYINDQIRGKIADTKGKVIEVIIPFKTSGKKDIAIYRYHEGEDVKIFDEEQTGADGTFYVKDDEIHLFTTKFSIYAIGYNVTSGGGGGGTSNVKVGDVTNGKVEISPKNAVAGQTVTVTATPDEGYKLEKLILTDENGNSITLTKVNDTTYTYVMPNSKVNVGAAFAMDGKCPQDETCVYAKFKDSDTKAWYHDGVHFCVERGYMIGVSAEKFAPFNTLSRGMIVTMLWRMEDSPATDYAMSFKDVANGMWYTEAIRWAQSTGVVLGYNDRSFGPEDNITREQLAAILMRYADFKGIDVSARANLEKFTDVKSISDWALENIRWANASGIITGRTETTIVPIGNATRVEAACMVQRFCETVLEK